MEIALKPIAAFHELALARPQSPGHGLPAGEDVDRVARERRGVSPNDLADGRQMTIRPQRFQQGCVVGGQPVTATYRHERVQHPPRGILGGLPGAGGRDLVNGAQVASKARITLDPGDTITFETPGGGGLGPPRERPAALIARDLEEGYVTTEGAARYRDGVVDA